MLKNPGPDAPQCTKEYGSPPGLVYNASYATPAAVQTSKDLAVMAWNGLSTLSVFPNNIDQPTELITRTVAHLVHVMYFTLRWSIIQPKL